MERIRTAAMGLLVHSTFTALVVHGFAVGSDGALNVARFAVWLVFVPLAVFTAIGLSKDEAVRKAAAELPQPGWFRALICAMSWGCLLIMVWCGALFTGAAWGFSMLMFSISRQRVDARRKEVNEAVMAAGRAAQATEGGV